MGENGKYSGFITARWTDFRRGLFVFATRAGSATGWVPRGEEIAVFAKRKRRDDEDAASLS